MHRWIYERMCVHNFFFTSHTHVCITVDIESSSFTNDMDVIIDNYKRKFQKIVLVFIKKLWKGVMRVEAVSRSVHTKRSRGRIIIVAIYCLHLMYSPILGQHTFKIYIFFCIYITQLIVYKLFFFIFEWIHVTSQPLFHNLRCLQIA